MSYSVITVPLYDTLGPDAVRYISNHAELRAVACSIALLPILLQNLQACPSISLVVRCHSSTHPLTSLLLYCSLTDLDVGGHCTAVLQLLFRAVNMTPGMRRKC